LQGSVAAQEPIVIEPIKGHCNLYTTGVYIPDFRNADLSKIEIPEPIFGGCYDTLAEALYVGSAGGINVPEFATMDQIKEAVDGYQPAARATSIAPETWQAAASTAGPYAIWI